MKDHAIPQDVTGYKFHIVGNMTLGQFAQLVVGAIASFLIYQTNLYPIIKWPIIFIFVILSVVAAFIPIAERPLSHWIKTFIQVLYRPTQFAWRRVPHIPEPFLFKPAADTGPMLPELDLTPLRRKRIQEFISTTHAIAGIDQEAQQIDQYYEHVFSLFDIPSAAIAQSPNPIQVNKPSLRVRMRSMRANPSTPISVEAALTTPEPESAPTVITALQQQPSAPITNRSVDANVAAPSQHGVVIPLEEIPSIEHSVQAESTTTETSASLALEERTLVQQQAPKQDLATSQVTFNKQLPFPSTPTTPNKLVGMVLTPGSELIEGAIIEIRTPEGQVARAVRSNALGQFYVTTPLANGDYVLVAEKNNRHFEPLSIKLKGKIVDPIEIRSTN